MSDSLFIWCLSWYWNHTPFSTCAIFSASFNDESLLPCEMPSLTCIWYVNFYRHLTLRMWVRLIIGHPARKEKGFVELFCDFPFYMCISHADTFMVFFIQHALRDTDNHFTTSNTFRPFLILKWDSGEIFFFFWKGHEEIL